MQLSLKEHVKAVSMLEEDYRRKAWKPFINSNKLYTDSEVMLAKVSYPGLENRTQNLEL